MAEGNGGAGASLVRATLAIHEPPGNYSTQPGAEIRTIDFSFNPTQVTIGRTSQWKYTPAPVERDGSVPEFIGPEPREMSLEIFLDSSLKPTSKSVMKKVEALLDCCSVTPESMGKLQPSPPWVVFRWGRFSTAEFTAYIRSVDATYTLFGTNGVPIRATCRLQLEEIPSKTKRQNPTSGAPNIQRVHRVVAGDSLQSLAWREYGDATVWRSIAEANKIDDPSRLRPGTELVLPAAEDVLR
ncbi:LysM peptidoglycan-binding domain-containing protein [Streptomyces sp. 7-21]|jgi:phage tail protein X|uniref:CIS tube protein n=1 Tax=Streptomyces sp. 7-21 TaxID=2802283 RepID=UPI00191D52B1|nr:LysM peptidoglycan-binding domain-containing protein [Streptomyces sp. 7-21]MBL1068016.1 LysM peptidoglycan-binding domain-containing protein [Streptomyces sp. 7-21]